MAHSAPPWSIVAAIQLGRLALPNLAQALQAEIQTLNGFLMQIPFFVKPNLLESRMNASHCAEMAQKYRTILRSHGLRGLQILSPLLSRRLNIQRVEVTSF